jgi:ribonuclease G
MPGIEHVGISRKITDPIERERLRELVRAHARPGEGFIVRTAAIGEKDEDLVQDVAFLRELWKETQARVADLRAPSLAWQDARLLQKVLRDLFREEVSSFWIDSEEAYREVVAFVEKLHPEWVERVKLWTSDLAIFEAFGLEQEIDAARQPKVYLKRGGSIIINQTEALVSVDVNTGKFVGKKDLEETVFLTNIEAIPEIVRQLRLRNLGGIVVIDFIDMADDPHRAAVLARLQDELRRDRNHARAESISELGLVEMTRKRTGPSLDRQLTDPCGTCGGSGRVPSPETILLKVYRELARQGEKLRGASARLTLHPDLRAQLPADAKDGLLALARALGAHLLWVERAEQSRQVIGLEILPPKA